MQNIRGSDLPTPMALSFLGDAVHSLLVREMLVARGIGKSGALNEQARLYVTAEAQAQGALRVLPHLTEEERDLYRRAHNSSHLNKPKHASGSDYRAATGFEAVLGALWHLGEVGRARELFAISIEETQHNEIQDKDGQEQ